MAEETVLRESAECVTQMYWREDFPKSTKVFAVGSDGVDTYLVCDAYGFDLALDIACTHNSALERKNEEAKAK